MEASVPIRSGSRREVLPAFAITIAIAIALYLVMEVVAPSLQGNSLLYSFGDLVAGCAEGTLFFRVMWLFTDFTEGSFIVSLLGSIFMCLVAPVSAYLENKKSPHAGTGVDGNGKYFGAMLLSAFLSILISQFLYGRSEWFAAYGFLPTFNSLLVAQTMITCYGKSWKKVLTAILIAGILPFPIAFVIMVYITIPLGLPGFIAVSLGLVITAPLVHLVAKHLPWMLAKDPEPGKAASTEPEQPAVFHPAQFFVHRIFGDIGELMIWGSSWGTMAMYLGTLLTWYLNPLHPVYGANNLPMLMLGQICTAALSIFLYYPSWKRDKWAFTFPGVVFTSAIINTYSNAWPIVISSILIGAAVFPPLVKALLKVFRYDGSYPAIGLIQLSISLVCIPWSFIVRYLITPLL